MVESDQSGASHLVLCYTGTDLRYNFSSGEIPTRAWALMSMSIAYLGLHLAWPLVTVSDVASPDSSYLNFETTGYSSSIYSK